MTYFCSVILRSRAFLIPDKEFYFSILKQNNWRCWSVILFQLKWRCIFSWNVCVTVLELDSPGSDYPHTADKQIPGIPGNVFSRLLLLPVPEKGDFGSNLSCATGKSSYLSGPLFFLLWKISRLNWTELFLEPLPMLLPCVSMKRTEITVYPLVPLGE